MGTTANIVLLLFAIAKSTLSASVDYRPIKIIVNENFNDQVGHEVQESPSLGANFVHQGANFFFNPEVRLPPGLIPPHIEALIASLQNKDTSIVIEKKPEIIVEDEDKIDVTAVKPIEVIAESLDKDIELEKRPEVIFEKEENIVKPIEVTAESFDKEIELEMKPEIVFENEGNIDITAVEPIEVIAESFDKDTELEMKPEIVFENEDNIGITAVKPIEVIAESVDEDNVNVLETIEIPEKPVPAPPEILPALPEIIEVPVELPVPEPEEVIYEDYLTINNESGYIIQELAPMPEAPVLPPLSLDFIPPAFTEEVKVEKPIEVVNPCEPKVIETPTLVEEPIEILPSIPNLPTGPILRPIVLPKFEGSFIKEKFIKPNPYLNDDIMVEEDSAPVIIALPREIFESALVEKDLIRLPELKFVQNEYSEKGYPFLTANSLSRNIIEERFMPNTIRKEQFPKVVELISVPKE